MQDVTANTRFWLFRQNNSDRSFDIDDDAGIGPRVWIEALDLYHAIARAEEIGLYFDGVAAGRDCGCCGDRWYAPWSDEGFSEVGLDSKSDFNWHPTVYVHRLDGSIERLTKPASAE